MHRNPSPGPLALSKGAEVCYYQSLVAVFQTDINPAGRPAASSLSATGFVCGTAVIEDDVSFRHGVTLGGPARRTRIATPRFAMAC